MKSSRDEPNQSKNNAIKVFTRPKGTVNKGNLFEPYNIANIVLNLVSDGNVERFYISSNDNQYGAFDDIVVTVEFNGIEKSTQYAIQLKHNDRGQLTEDRLKGHKDFSIRKYYESWKKINRDVQNYILFTNLKFQVKEDILVDIDGEEFLLRPKNVNDEAVKFINTSDSGNFCYRFEIVNESTNHQFQDFLNKFYLYVSQQNLDGIKKHTAEKFKEMFSSDEFDKFFKVISEWSMEEGKTEKLDKEWMQNAITLHVLSSKIKPLSFCEVNQNMRILREAIGMFDFTLLEKEASYEIVKELWGDIKSSFKDTKEINRMRIKYQLDSIFIQNFEESEAKLSSQLLWLTGKCPLVITKDKTVEKVIRICERTNFIVIDENLYKGWLKSSPFQNLSDLRERNFVKFQEILNRFTCSLQGKNIVLKKLVDEGEEFLDFITTDDLLDMLNGTFSIGGGKEILCEPYIERFLSRNFIDVKYLQNCDDAILIIIDCVRNENDLKKKFPKHSFINVDEVTNEKMKFDGNSKLKSSDKYGATIYISKNKCDVFKFQQVCAKNEEKKICHLLRLENSDTLEWIRSKGDTEALEKHKISNKVFVPEKTLFSSEPENNINVIIGDPGLGKSELMKSLKNNCLETFWTVIMYPKDVFKLCQNLKNGTNNEENFEHFIFDIKCKSLSAKEKNVFGLLSKQKKVLYVWEALDEVSNDQLRKVTEIVNQFSKKGFTQWITSRLILKNYLEKTFSVLAISINKFNEHEQHSYINERLKNKCDSDKIRKVVDKLESTFVLIEHVDILGIPLQLYMLTELFLQDIDGYLEKFTNTFVLSDLYFYFVEEKFNVYFKEKLKIDIDIPGNQVLIKSHTLDALKYFQVMSMKTLLPENTLEELNLNYQNYIQKAQNYNLIGIVSEIISDIPRFIHSSFAEYFVAVYFSENFQNKTIMNVMKEFIFDERFDNVRFFFDLMLIKISDEECLGHVAILHKNFDLLKTYDIEILTRRDIGGRTVLHLASSWGQRCPTLPVTRKEEIFIINDEAARNLKVENPKFQQIFQYLLEICASNKTDSLFNMNCLSYAQKSNCVFAEIKLILDQKLILNEPEKDAVLLYCSSLFGYVDALELFNSENFTSSSIFNTRNYYDQTVLLIACKSGHEKIVEFLVLRGAGINVADNNGRTPLSVASYSGHAQIVDFLVGKGSEINLCDKKGFTPLSVASLEGHVKVVEFLVAKGAEINLTNNGFTPLYVASESGHLEIVEFLISKGAEINLSSKDGGTALYTASFNGYNKIVELLVAKGAEINRSTKDGYTPLFVASLSGRDKVVEVLATKGAEINLTDKNGVTPLSAASQEKHYKIVEILVRNGAEINLADKNGVTPLFIAAQNGHNEIVELLIAKGAQVNVALKDGRTPLYAASQSGHNKLIKFLVTKGAEINLAQSNGRTPLFVASQQGHEKIVEFLAAKGAEINLADKEGFTPLHLASGNGHDKIVEILVAKGAKVNRASKKGCTPLFIASLAGYEKIADFLIAKGAEINLADNNGATPLYLASERGHYKTLQLIVERGAEINIIDNNGSTPLHMASLNGHDKIVEFLIAKGAKVNLAHKDGFTPLHLASQNGHDKIVEFLIANGAQINAALKHGTTSLFAACFNGHDKIVKFLVTKGAEINLAHPDGITPLFVASKNGHGKIVEFLKAKGAE